MSEKKLKLVKEPKKLQESSNFWRSCPLYKEYMPESICKKANKDAVNRCPWWIASEEHSNCFWTYVSDKSDVNGVMKDLNQTQISKLLDWSYSKTNLVMKEAEEKLLTALEEHDAKDLIVFLKT